MEGCTSRRMLHWTLTIFCLVVHHKAFLHAQNASSGVPCEGWLGLQGTCTDISCPTLLNEYNTIPSGEFLKRHSPPCENKDGVLLLCCPLSNREAGIKRCGYSKLAPKKPVTPGSWPWLGVIYTEIKGSNGWVGYTTSGCVGVLISDRHVLTNKNCGANRFVASQIRFGKHVLKDENESDIERVNIADTIVPFTWRDKDVYLSILVLQSAVTLKPDKVWPICLSEDPVADIGFSLDGLGPIEKRHGIVSFWHKSTETASDNSLQHSQVFFSNCSGLCETFKDSYNCNSYNETKGNRNPLCMGGQTTAECLDIHKMNSFPFIVQSQKTGKFFLAGIARDKHCDHKTLSTLLEPITPYVKTIKNTVNIS